MSTDSNYENQFSDYDSGGVTLDILSDEDVMDALAEADDDVANGDLYDLAEMAEEYGYLRSLGVEHGDSYDIDADNPDY
jgi:hypothetical protein